MRADRADVAPIVGWAGPRQWPTGAKLFLTLSLALLPLAAIGMLATLQTTRTFDDENRARLHLLAAESSRSIAIELMGDMNALRGAANSLDRDVADQPICARVRGAFAQQEAVGSRFAILDRQGRLICGERFPGLFPPSRAAGATPLTASILPGRGVVLGVSGGRGHASASAFFPVTLLAGISRPSGYTPPFAASIAQGTARLPLAALPDRIGIDRRQTLVTALGIDSLELVTEMRAAPITAPLLVALLLPLVMWAAAAGIGWFVVDRLLIRPLRQLRSSVAAYHPGDLIDAGFTRALPAHEIRDLGDTFRAISRTVSLHEAGLAEGLVRQTRLTREVHHRVKNNLQVISSLINIHARGAHSPEASAAYASIQRRVDALAVVHRNHFAEAEVTRGLPLRSMLTELASNIRATAPERSAHLGITLDLEPFFASQDVAVAVSFLVTEAVELAMTVDPVAQVRIALKAADAPKQAILTISSQALREGEALREALQSRYGRVMEGLARQLRAKLAHDAEAGSYALAIAVVGRE